jgi:hypothetical protein
MRCVGEVFRGLLSGMLGPQNTSAGVDPPSESGELDHCPYAMLFLFIGRLDGVRP